MARRSCGCVRKREMSRLPNQGLRYYSRVPPRTSHGRKRRDGARKQRRDGTDLPALRRGALRQTPSRAGEGRCVRRRGSRVDQPAAYHAESVLYLTEKARFATVLNLPERANVGKAVNDAMADIEKHNPQLAGVLPRSYQLFSGTLLKDLMEKVSEIPSNVEYEAFGRIHEYFLGEFARTEGSRGGESYTSASIVRLIVEILASATSRPRTRANAIAPRASSTTIGTTPRSPGNTAKVFLTKSIGCSTPIGRTVISPRCLRRARTS